MITILGLALGALFIAVPLCVAQAYGVALGGKIAAAFAKMLLRVGVCGLAVHYLVQSGSMLLCGVMALAVAMYYVVSVVVRARLSLVQFIVPVGAGLLGAVMVAASVLLFANVAVGSDFCLRYALPVVAMLSGGIADPMAKALATYYMGLRHHNHLYYYLIGNGASVGEALRYLQKRALEKSMQPGIRTMATTAAGVSPVVMWTMLMGGRTALEAAAWQVLLTAAVFAAAVVAVWIALEVARKYVVDGYAMLKVKGAADDKSDAAKSAADDVMNVKNVTNVINDPNVVNDKDFPNDSELPKDYTNNEQI